MLCQIAGALPGLTAPIAECFACMYVSQLSSGGQALQLLVHLRPALLWSDTCILQSLEDSRDPLGCLRVGLQVMLRRPCYCEQKLGI